MPLLHYIFLITTIFYNLLTTSSPYEIPYGYTNCTNTYSCGHIKDISYPFTGGDRPDYCGHPAFKLTCQNNISTQLTHKSATYQVLNINQSAKTLTLVFQDLYNTTCPSRFSNATLDAFFTINNLDDMLTLIYGCNPTYVPLKPQSQFTCNIRNARFNHAYYILGPAPSDLVLSFMYCSFSVVVPMLREVGEKLKSSRMSLMEALREGFIVNYSDPYERMCKECDENGGQCGYDSNLDVPLCVCGDRPCPFALSPQSSDVEGKKKNKTTLGIGLGIAGAIAAGILVGWWIILCRRRRRRVAAAQTAHSAKAVTKEIVSDTSSKALISSGSSAFTNSIPSYPSPTLKSDLGRRSSYFGVQIFSYGELEEATDSFSESRELGDGGFGAVYYGVLSDGRVVAVKRLYEHNFKRMVQFMNEIEILAKLQHQNLVHLYGCTSKTSRDLLLVYEYIPNGTVADHLHGKLANSGQLSWPVRLNIAVETADALAYLHRKDIIHRDVKTNNILLDKEFHVKVADFGLSRLFPLDATHVSTAPQGTPGYVDPEYYQVYQLTEKSDVFSFGVVLIELISSLQAVDIDRHRQDINLGSMAVNKIQNDALHELVDPTLGFGTDSSIRRMISLVSELAFRCLQQEKDTRPSMEEVFETLRGIQYEELNIQKEEVVEIVVDDVALLKGNSDPPSPDKGLNISVPNSV